MAERLAPPGSAPSPKSAPADPPVFDDDTRADDGSGARRDRRIALVAILLALVPVVCVLVFRAGREYLPLGDEAVIDLRVRDVFTAHTPLVGVYSRGFNHPGPILYWLLAPLSELTGHEAWAIMVGGALLQGAAIALCGWLAFRRGGLLLCVSVLAALGLAYSSFAFGSQFVQPWNPNVAFPFFMLFLLQAWALATGSRWQLLGLVLTGTLLVQLHVGYLPLVGAAFVWALAVVAYDARRGREPSEPGTQPPWRRVVAFAAIAAVLLWVVVLVQQLVQDPGNLSKLYEYFTGADRFAGLQRGAGLFAAEFHFPPPWLGGRDQIDFFSDEVGGASLKWLVVPAILLVVGFLAARRSGRRNDRRMVELAALNAVVTILVISRVSVQLQAFVFYWRVIGAVFLVVAVWWAVVGWLRLDARRVRWIPAIALLVVIAVFFGARARDDVIRDNVAFNPTVDNVGHLISEVHAAGLPERPFLMRGLGPTTYGLAPALFDDLDRAGAPVRVDRKYGYEYANHRTAGVDQVDEIWYVGAAGNRLSILEKHPGGRLVAAVTPLAPAEERELRDLQRTLRQKLIDADRADLVGALDTVLVGFVLDDAKVPGISRAEIDRLVQLNVEVDHSGKCRCFVVAYPRRLAPHLPSSMGY